MGKLVAEDVIENGYVPWLSGIIFYFLFFNLGICTNLTKIGASQLNLIIIIVKNCIKVFKKHASKSILI